MRLLGTGRYLTVWLGLIIQEPSFLRIKSGPLEILRSGRRTLPVAMG
jgi:hypothetical protein